MAKIAVYITASWSLIMFTVIILDKIRGIKEVWLLGDNFSATTYRKYFSEISEVLEESRQKRDEDKDISFEFYIKKHFDFNMFCNSCFNSPTQNMLVCLQNTFVSTVNKHDNLPQYMMVILDSDLIDYLGFEEAGMAQLLRDWVDWLVKEFSAALSTRVEQLPAKAKILPCVYWVLLLVHINFSDRSNNSRKKFNFCIESLLKGRSDMRVIKLKDRWDFNDPTLVQKGRFTEAGKYAYWEAIDSAFQFNVQCHELFLAKSKCNSNRVTSPQPERSTM